MVRCMGACVGACVGAWLNKCVGGGCEVGSVRLDTQGERKWLLKIFSEIERGLGAGDVLKGRGGWCWVGGWLSAGVLVGKVGKGRCGCEVMASKLDLDFEEMTCLGFS